jgi:hypothetical protein
MVPEGTPSSRSLVRRLSACLPVQMDVVTALHRWDPVQARFAPFGSSLPPRPPALKLEAEAAPRLLGINTAGLT